MQVRAIREPPLLNGRQLLEGVDARPVSGHGVTFLRGHDGGGYVRPGHRAGCGHLSKDRGG